MTQIIDFLASQTIIIWLLGFVILFIIIAVLNPESFRFYGKRFFYTDEAVNPPCKKRYFKTSNAQRFKWLHYLLIGAFIFWIILGFVHGMNHQWAVFFDFFWPVFLIVVVVCSLIAVVFYRHRFEWGSEPMTS